MSHMIAVDQSSTHTPWLRIALYIASGAIRGWMTTITSRRLRVWGFSYGEGAPNSYQAAADDGEERGAPERHDVSAAAGGIRWVAPPAHMGLYFG